MTKITKKHIAPCGMNCALCKAFLREDNKCPGCFAGRKANNRPIKCARKLCKKRKGKYCYECDGFPCKNIKILDERYKRKYGMSEIENLEFIRDKGVSEFIDEQEKKYVKGDQILCVHDKKWYKNNQGK